MVIIIAIATIIAIAYLVYWLNGPTMYVGPCIFQRGYLCYALSLAPINNLSFTFSQNTWYTQYNAHIVCTTSASPPPATQFSNISTNNILVNNNAVRIVNLPCYKGDGQPFNFSIGDTFSGYLWLRYTNSITAPSDSNPWHIVKIAVIETKAI